MALGQRDILEEFINGELVEAVASVAAIDVELGTRNQVRFAIDIQLEIFGDLLEELLPVDVSG